MNSTSLSKTKIAILAAFIYTAVMGFGMFYMKTFKNIFYEKKLSINLRLMRSLFGGISNLICLIEKTKEVVAIVGTIP
jgi:hypothetical protein